MTKLLCIVGPTATGKTKLAISLFRQFPSVLISADSRQVYRGMDIVTGKDHPKDVSLLGVDIVEPNEECSVSVWYDSIKPILLSNKLPIVVGGTGFYVKALTNGIATIEVKPDNALRQELNALSLIELQSKLKKLAPVKYESMNSSDINNPRRLIRAIEVASNPVSVHSQVLPDSLIIGLECRDQNKYRELVQERVIARINEGAVKETRELLSKFDHNLPSLTAIGYRSLIKFIKGDLTEKQMISQWTLEEIQYSKRQLTWFKKIPNIQWFDITDEKKHEKIAKLASIWYAKKEYL